MPGSSFSRFASISKQRVAQLPFVAVLHLPHHDPDNPEFRTARICSASCMTDMA